MTISRLIVVPTALVLLGCAPAPTPTTNAGQTDRPTDRPTDRAATEPDLRSGAAGPVARAVFAGGCFWCMQPPFDKIDGVVSTSVGYTGGDEPNPTYGQVSAGKTGHREAIEVRYRPSRVSYERLLQVFWRSIDPTDGNGQFADQGPHYAPAIYYQDEAQRRAAERSKAELQRSGRFSKAVVVPILPAKPFYAAEGYHQQYYRKNPTAYLRYKIGSGRAGFLERVWKRQVKK